MKNIRVIPKKHRNQMTDIAEDFYQVAGKLERFMYNEKVCPKKLEKSFRKMYLDLHGHAAYLGRLSMIGC